jgi:hypothetical protein
MSITQDGRPGWLPDGRLGDLAEEIALPDPSAVAVSLQHIEQVTAPLLSSLIQSLAVSKAYSEQLATTCQRLQAQNAQLRARLAGES